MNNLIQKDLCALEKDIDHFDMYSITLSSCATSLGHRNGVTLTGFVLAQSELTLLGPPMLALTNRLPARVPVRLGVCIHVCTGRHTRRCLGYDNMPT